MGWLGAPQSIHSPTSHSQSHFPCPSEQAHTMSSSASVSPKTEPKSPKSPKSSIDSEDMSGTVTPPKVPLVRDNCVLTRTHSQDKPGFKTVKFSPTTELNQLSITEKKRNKRKQQTPMKRPGKVGKWTSPEISNIQIKTLFRGNMSDMKPLVRVMFDVTSGEGESDQE